MYLKALFCLCCYHCLSLDMHFDSVPLNDVVPEPSRHTLHKGEQFDGKDIHGLLYITVHEAFWLNTSRINAFQETM